MVKQKIFKKKKKKKKKKKFTKKFFLNTYKHKYFCCICQNSTRLEFVRLKVSGIIASATLPTGFILLVFILHVGIKLLFLKPFFPPSKKNKCPIYDLPQFPSNKSNGLTEVNPQNSMLQSRNISQNKLGPISVYFRCLH